ncbi:MAG: putative nucleic acid-binding protein [Candidatus Promineifilaceae bacterium]|jgi:predicted nucleic acid-binding protein
MSAVMLSGDFMATTNTPSVVTDAGPVIHLDELDCLDLINDFDSLHTTRTVWQEVLSHRPRLKPAALPAMKLHDIDSVSIPSTLASEATAFDLAGGEVSVILLLEQLLAGILFCDDAAARLVAESRGHRVHGTVGIVARAVRRGLRTRSQTVEILKSIPERSSLHIRPSLLNEICKQVETGG